MEKKNEKNVAKNVKSEEKKDAKAEASEKKAREKVIDKKTMKATTPAGVEIDVPVVVVNYGGETKYFGTRAEAVTYLKSARAANKSCEIVKLIAKLQAKLDTGSKEALEAKEGADRDAVIAKFLGKMTIATMDKLCDILDKAKTEAVQGVPTATPAAKPQPKK